MKKISVILMVVALVLGMTQCKKKVESLTSTQNGIRITLRIEDGSKHHVITSGDPYPGDLGKVVFDDEDLIYVVNGGNIAGALQYDAELGFFTGIIGVDVTEDDMPAVALDENDYLHFIFMSNAQIDMDEYGNITVTIRGQKRNLPVISYGHTAEHYTSGQTDFTCELQNQCALAKFTFENVNSEIGLAANDEVCVSGFTTRAILTMSETGIAITPDPTSTGPISLYHPSDAPANERWAILFAQDAISGKNMLIRNWLYTGNVNVDAVSNNELKEITVSCSGTPTKKYFFTVRQGKKSFFSPGNLQYKATGSDAGYRFAEHQWDYVGGVDGDNVQHGNVFVDTIQSNNNNISSSYAGWIDLFGYGTGDDPTKVTADKDDFTTYNDWGEYVNFNDGYSWYAPNAAEWLCMMDYRPNDDAVELGYQDDLRHNQCGPATVHGVEGMVFLCDYFEFPESYPASNFTPQNLETTQWNAYSLNTFTDTQWAQMETNGAIFIPAAGCREPIVENDVVVNTYRRYGSWRWSYWAWNPYWRPYPANILGMYSQPGLTVDRAHWGASVRLMREFIY